MGVCLANYLLMLFGVAVGVARSQHMAKTCTLCARLTSCVNPMICASRSLDTRYAGRRQSTEEWRA
eukprot:3724445-Pleurochrysis_carterae.AAC.1